MHDAPDSGPDPGAEILDVVDDADQVVGQAIRGEVYARQLRHRAVAILCRDGAGRIFVHRRSAGKLLWPSMYDVLIGGAVGAGESYAEAAAREAAEELGTAGPVPVQPLFRHRFDGDPPEWIGVFETVGPVGTVRPPAAEIAWHAFLPEAEVVARLESGAWPVVPDSLEIFRRYLDARDSAG